MQQRLKNKYILKYDTFKTNINCFTLSWFKLFKLKINRNGIKILRRVFDVIFKKASFCEFLSMTSLLDEIPVKINDKNLFYFVNGNESYRTLIQNTMKF